jgi:putative pyruvate formate lyase activating enzyme
VTATARVARAALHFGEEPCISGTRGSGTVFFAGCPLHCRFCQNRSISQEGFGKEVSPARLAEIFRELEATGAHNINLVSATQFVPIVRQALELYKPSVPIVYNSGGYERVETLRTLDGLVDIYLPDFKYIDNALGQALSGVADYAERTTEAIAEMARQTGPMQLDENGLATRGTMVRHLVLPGHTRHSMAVLDHLAATLPHGVFVSLLFQYTPMGDIEGFPTLSRAVTRREREKVFDYMLACGLTDGYAQEAGSASKGYIPAFDLTGV